ncbi:MAG TPA: hypothetical protein ENI70_01530, partial [Candidatus Peregrinibacteria bacterium]|nr:hypothetical protein [Candidatus Peregrinibacteria bacterium]
GIGIGTVHDRGGAIIASEDSDRIDIWMGHGDEGLQRALNLGVKRVTGTIYPSKTTQLADNIYFPKVSLSHLIKNRSLLASNVGLNDRGDNVRKIQESLKKLGYYGKKVTGHYGPSTVNAVYLFQVESKIITGEDDLGAGYFGNQTSLSLSKKIKGLEEKVKEELPKKGLGKGDKGEEVKKLQEILKKLGYFQEETTGFYGLKTTAAVLDFQKDKKVVKKNTDKGAGHFGPGTYSALLGTIIQLEEDIPEEPSKELAKEEDLFARTLALNDQGEDVKSLQEYLKEFGYFKYPHLTKTYGYKTQEAVLAFQKDQKIIKKNTDHGAGVFGPTTQKTLQKLLRERGSILSKNHILISSSIVGVAGN